MRCDSLAGERVMRLCSRLPDASAALHRLLRARSNACVPRAACYSTATCKDAQHAAVRPCPTVDKVVRVSHAGEYAANRIYEGQMSILGDTSVGSSIQDMWEQEKAHLELFNGLVERRRVRPTLFLPLWDIAGYVLGAGTAMLGREAAMACTVAVEETVVEHYNSQLRELLATGGGDEQLLQVISKCRDEELEHKDVALEHNAQLAPGYEAMSEVIKAGCRTAIWISERL